MQWINRARAALLLVALAGRVDAQPAPLALLDVPFISQSEALCGGAAAAMVLRYWGERGLTADSFAHLVDRSAAGIQSGVLVDELRRRGWTVIVADGIDARLDEELQRGRPVLTLIEDRPSTFHYVVIVGTTPDAIIFHDPARAPLRVISRAEFSRRWQHARRWMAIVVPGDRTSPLQPPPSFAASTGQRTCDQLIVTGVERAQANDLSAAEHDLTMALSCGGATALRELAGVRVLQNRWADVEALSTTATALEPQEPYGWRLLGTSRFVQNDRAGALAAWNRIGEPRLDLLRIGGLERTRQRVVERLIDARPRSLVTPDLLVRSERRLRELPAAASASVEAVPVPGGMAEIRAAVNERPAVPADRWSYMVLGAQAAAQQQVALTIGSLTGGGERSEIEWRFWPGRPRVALSFDAPAAWGGVWGVQAFVERERFTEPLLPEAQRSGGSVRWTTWVNAVSRLEFNIGAERWDDARALGRARVDLRVLSSGARVDWRGAAETWRGDAAFSRAEMTVTAVSSVKRSGRVYVGRTGGAISSPDLPPMLRFGGDTGQTRPTLLRAHPLVTDGRLRSDRLGRNLLHVSAEAQQWWAIGLIRAGAAAFTDAVRTGDRLTPSARSDMDVGVGARLALPGVPGTFRADLARGLRDAVTRWSFVYEPGG